MNNTYLKILRSKVKKLRRFVTLSPVSCEEEKKFFLNYFVTWKELNSYLTQA